MTSMQPEAQWFIARDSTQHGPLSDAEMKKLVELSYLRPTDLIWRQGFPDWRPALAVFPQPQAAQPSPAAPEASRAPAQFGAPLPNEPRTGRPAAPEQDSLSLSPESAYEIYDEEPYKSGRGRRLAIAAIVLAVIGVGGYLGFLNRDRIMTLATSMSTGGFSTGSVETPDSVDSKLQRTELWAFAKDKFPDWYKERIDQVAKLTSEKKDEKEIVKYLVDELVKFRRVHSDEALQAPSPALKHVAETFRDTLKQLSQQNIDTCYQFISHGESSDAVLQIMGKMESTSPIQSQLKSIFAAVAEGRASPTKREPKAPQDLDALTGELTRVGWSQDDIKLFFDPKAFSRAPPERVCQMVQDLFTALLSIQDAGAQDRLLIETLRHVMAG
jgi:hypothetical protein